jgi:hypothetical protein
MDVLDASSRKSTLCERRAVQHDRLDMVKVGNEEKAGHYLTDAVTFPEPSEPRFLIRQFGWIERII